MRGMLRLQWEPWCLPTTPRDQRPMTKLLAWFRHNPNVTTLYIGSAGINLHWKGGIAISGIPRTGGTTLCWGRMRRETMKREEGRLLSEIRDRTTVHTFGPFMLRVGRHF